MKDGCPINQELNNPDGMQVLTKEEWDERMDKMIAAFQVMHDEDHQTGEYDYKKYMALSKEEMLALWKKQYNTVNEGLSLFAKYYKSLWT